ncbi:ycf20-like protein isoform X1 [Phaseolus vulgaris]
MLLMFIISRSEDCACCLQTRMMSSGCMTRAKFISLDYNCSRVSKVDLAAFFYKTTFGQKQCSPCFSFAQPCLIVNFKRMTWSVRNSLNDSSFSSSTSNGSNGRTRIIRVIQEFQSKLGSKIQEVKKNLPMKLFFFLVGFYCATAFATVIGQTGDWDILSAALAVAIVEVIGALMYRASLPLVSKNRGLISLFNYWKAGLTLGLFLDSFKY